MRLKAKKEMKAAKDLSDKTKLDAIQSSFKILINSFYGYLGYSRGLFNDTIAADRVTKTGQELLRTVDQGDRREKGNGRGGGYRRSLLRAPLPPSGLKNRSSGSSGVWRSVLPEGISLALNGRYRKMLSYKPKNYALEGYDGKITLKGSSLTSRSVERFGRKYVRNCIEAILHGDVGRLHGEYVDRYREISSNGLPVEEFSRTETLKDTPGNTWKRSTAAGGTGPRPTRRPSGPWANGDGVRKFRSTSRATTPQARVSPIAGSPRNGIPSHRTRMFRFTSGAWRNCRGNLSCFSLRRISGRSSRRKTSSVFLRKASTS